MQLERREVPIWFVFALALLAAAGTIFVTWGVIS
jgi:hypothetical protein